MSTESSKIHCSEQEMDVQRIKASLRELVNSFNGQSRNENSHLDLILQNLESIIKAAPSLTKTKTNLTCPSEAKKNPQLPSNNEIGSIHQAEFPNPCEDKGDDVPPSSPDQLFDRPCTVTGIMSGTKRKLTSDINLPALLEGETGETFAKKQREGTMPPKVETPLKLESDLESESEEYFYESLPIAQVPADHQMFTIELIMLQIFKKLQDAQLINCRRVNSYFKIFATQVLERRPSFQIKMKYDWRSHKYVKQSKFDAYKKCINKQLIATMNKRRLEKRGRVDTQNMDFQVESEALNFTLGSLSSFMQSYGDSEPRFPCKSFNFIEGTLCSEDIQDFLSTHGYRMKALSLDLFGPRPESTAAYVNDYPTINMLRVLLLNQAPNLKSVHLNKVPQEWKNSLQRLFPDPLQRMAEAEAEAENQNHLRDFCLLPNLKSASLNDLPDRILLDLVRVGSNLQEIHRCTNILTLVKANKFHLIKSLWWVPPPEDIIHCKWLLPLPRTTSGGFGLATFILSLSKIGDEPDLWDGASKFIEMILGTCSATLSTFGWGASMGFLPNLNWPVMPKVTAVKIGSSLNQILKTSILSKKIFTPGFQLSSTFPNLTKVSFSLPHLNCEDLWKTYFESGVDFEPVLSVKFISFHKTMTVPFGWMEHLSRVFPNVSVVYIDTTLMFLADAARTGLWNFQKLKHLRIELNANSPSNSFPVTDSAFTGLSIGTVSNLFHMSHEADVSTVAHLREHPSICNLQRIQTLHLVFVDKCKKAQKGNYTYTTTMSHVTGLFAFQMCPLLKVVMEYKVSNRANLMPLKKAYSHLLPYVTEVPESNSEL